MSDLATLSDAELAQRIKSKLVEYEDLQQRILELRRVADVVGEELRALRAKQMERSKNKPVLD